MNDKKIYSLGIIGVRGYVGKELLALISNHPQIQTQWLSSRQLAGQRAKSVFDDTDLTRGDLDFDIESLSPEEAAAKDTDIIVLALPNGLAEPFVQALEASGNCRLILDLSADYRFPEPDDDKNWIYSVPELDHTKTGYIQSLSWIIRIWKKPGPQNSSRSVTRAAMQPPCYWVCLQ